jgi:hypothetical protein
VFLVVCVSLNIVMGALAIASAVRAARSAHWKWTLIAYWMTFLWIETFAFPVLGPLS